MLNQKPDVAPCAFVQLSVACTASDVGHSLNSLPSMIPFPQLNAQPATIKPDKLETLAGKTRAQLKNRFSRWRLGILSETRWRSCDKDAEESADFGWK